MNVNDDNQYQDHLFSNVNRKRKCHGNRKAQRLRKRWRARGMKPTTIEKLLKRKNQTRTIAGSNQTNSNTMVTIGTSNTMSTERQPSLTQTTISNNIFKRKRVMSLQDIKSNPMIIKSTSSISMAQSALKKMKNETERMTEPPTKGEEDGTIKIPR